MISWQLFKEQAPELAAYGAARFGSGVAYLGTIRADGSPRVHPVTPIIGQDLFLFMEPTSPKGKDLQRDGRYVLHSAVEDSGGGAGEFYVRGHAERIENASIREVAVYASPYKPRDRYILFRLSIAFAFMNTYIDGASNVSRWRS